MQEIPSALSGNKQLSPWSPKEDADSFRKERQSVLAKTVCVLMLQYGRQGDRESNQGNVVIILSIHIFFLL